MRIFIVAVAAATLATAALGDLLVGFDFAGYAGDELTGTSTVENAGLQTCYISRGTGLTAYANADSFSSRSWTIGGTESDAVNNSDYLTWTLNAKAGYSFTVTNIVFNWQRSATGPSNAFLRSSLDSFSSDLATWDVSADGTYEADLSGAGLTNLTSIEFRFYGYQAGGSLGSGRYEGSGNDLVINGIAAIPEPTTVGMLGIGLIGLAIARRRRRR